jgi:hypothetical protein
LRKRLDDTGNGSILDIKAQVTCLVHELGEHLDRTNEMEEVFRNELLAVMGIGTKEIPPLSAMSSSFLLRAKPSRSRISSAVSAKWAIGRKTYHLGEAVGNW